MTPHELYQCRKRLGMGANELAMALGLTSEHTGPDGRSRSWQKAGLRILEMERGTRKISGPVAVAVEAMLTGWRPKHYVRDRDEVDADA